jgi:hypothetical protein
MGIIFKKPRNEDIKSVLGNYLTISVVGQGVLWLEMILKQAGTEQFQTQAQRRWFVEAALLFNKPNCAISSGFAVTYCTGIGLGLAAGLSLGLRLKNHQN